MRNRCTTLFIIAESEILFVTSILRYLLAICFYRHKTRLHIGQLVKDTSDKLKQASEIDHHADVNVSLSLCFYLSISISIACAN